MPPVNDGRGGGKSRLPRRRLLLEPQHLPAVRRLGDQPLEERITLRTDGVGIVIES
jgi:hypothetical protein